MCSWQGRLLPVPTSPAPRLTSLRAGQARKGGVCCQGVPVCPTRQLRPPYKCNLVQRGFTTPMHNSCYRRQYAPSSWNLSGPGNKLRRKLKLKPSNLALPSDLSLTSRSRLSSRHDRSTWHRAEYKHHGTSLHSGGRPLPRQGGSKSSSTKPTARHGGVDKQLSKP